ncbi:hypothetical protein [Actibacterium ureilyticum]|uniref:hypothetical protein n=1 Tax=Actibacterium ureilyticum TaxID=1590614 RepID=UPI000BAAE167|nr:hypothetical protein [Actibacterium ureilyticum]
MQFLNITRWPVLLVLAAAGAAVVIFAFVTVNLFSLAMANVYFIREHGWLAIRAGALVQMAWLGLGGAVALASWLAFKILESEVTRRYRIWAERDPGGD